ncbi:MAG TPA: transglutaminase family protein [Polyangiales bacterium]|nr:transglutaminase family protein [Polyangiales bacterium]
MKDALLDEVNEHDQRLSRQGIEIWVGSEPTFTNARSQDPCWISEALGGEKEAHAKALLLSLASQLPGPLELLQVYGRLYPGETAPRFCYGALSPRHATHGSNIASCCRLDLINATPTPRADQAWLTVTPDPAVVEVNMAPAHDLATFARRTDAVWNAAAAASLSAERMRYNGDITDSGGGGGLHPHVPAHDPWHLDWICGSRNQRIQLHAWHPDGGGYEGLPLSASEARERRRARVVTSQNTEPLRPRSSGTTENRLDLRRLTTADAAKTPAAEPQHSKQFAPAAKDHCPA